MTGSIYETGQQRAGHKELLEFVDNSWPARCCPTKLLYAELNKYYNKVSNTPKEKFI